MRLLTLLAITAASLTRFAYGKLQVGFPSGQLVQCGGPVQLQWSGQEGQTRVYVVDQYNSIIVPFGQEPLDTESLTWYPVNATGGSKIRVAVTDDAGSQATSPILTVQDSNDESCLTQNQALPSFTLFGAGASTGSSSSTPAASSPSSSPSNNSSGAKSTPTTAPSSTGSASSASAGKTNASDAQTTNANGGTGNGAIRMMGTDRTLLAGALACISLYLI